MEEHLMVLSPAIPPRSPGGGVELVVVKVVAKAVPCRAGVK